MPDNAPAHALPCPCASCPCDPPFHRVVAVCRAPAIRRPLSHPIAYRNYSTAKLVQFLRHPHYSWWLIRSILSVGISRTHSIEEALHSRPTSLSDRELLLGLGQAHSGPARTASLLCRQPLCHAGLALRGAASRARYARVSAVDRGGARQPAALPFRDSGEPLRGVFLRRVRHRRQPAHLRGRPRRAGRRPP